MKNIFRLLIIITVIGSLSLQCKKDDDTEPKKNDTVSTFVDSTILLDASSKTLWKYYSFEKSDTIHITDPLNSLDWDIAFKRDKVKTNGGKSGMGSAGSLETSFTSQTGFDLLDSVPPSITFQVDDSTEVEDYNPADPMHPLVTKQILNENLYHWYTRVQQGAASVLKSNETVYILKTAKGKYAKLWIQSYYNNEGTSGYYTLTYKFQKDGTTKLNK